MTTWFTADQHFGHKNIIQYCARPFVNVEAMTEGLVDRHNALVRDGDTVWHVGDFALKERLVPEILGRLRGEHNLVPGNHDRCHRSHRSHEAARRRYLTFGFKEVVDFALVDNDRFLVTHLPYAGDSRQVERFLEFRPRDDGTWLLCGHVHEKWKVRDRMLNVGVDQWDYAPVSLETLVQLRNEHGGADGRPTDSEV